MSSKSWSTSTNSKLRGLLWLALAACATVLLVLGTHALAHLVPWSLERKMGSWIDVSAGSKTCRNPDGLRALGKLTGRLHPLDAADRAMPITVVVLDRSEINAFASFGGRVFVLRGLLKTARTPEEVAGVLAHEFEHVKRRHIAEGTLVQVVTGFLTWALSGGGPLDTRWFALFAQLKFSRDQEAEADRGGLERLKAAEISAQGFVDFFGRMDSEAPGSALLSDHPSPADREELARSYLGKGVTRPVLSDVEWKALRRICEP